MKKRFVGIGVATALTMSLGTAGLAFGVNITPERGIGAPVILEVTYDAPASYTITIPDTVTLGTPADVTVAANYVLPSTKKFTISAEAGEFSNGNTTNADTFTPGMEAGTGTPLVIAGTDTDKSTEKKFSVTYKKPDSTKYADTYTGRVTFSVVEASV